MPRIGPLLLAFLLTGCLGPAPGASTAVAPATPATEPPLVLGAIGNSLMLAYNADAQHIGPAPDLAWATGNESWSLRARLGAARVENVAAPGPGSSAYAGQAAKVRDATLVLALVPDDQLCAPPSPDADPARYERQLREGTSALRSRGIRVMLLSAPDLASVAAAARAKPPANDLILFYATGQRCAAQPDLAAKQAAMNEAIQRVARDTGARTDGGAIGRIRWTPDMVSDVDGFHPSPAGLRAIADAVWGAG